MIDTLFPLSFRTSLRRFSHLFLRAEMRLFSVSCGKRSFSSKSLCPSIRAAPLADFFAIGIPLLPRNPYLMPRCSFLRFPRVSFPFPNGEKSRLFIGQSLFPFDKRQLCVFFFTYDFRIFCSFTAATLWTIGLSYFHIVSLLLMNVPFFPRCV